MKIKALLLSILLIGMNAGNSYAQDWKSILSDAAEKLLGDKATTEVTIYGKWDYVSPECQLKSEDLLAKAGGEVIAAEIEKELVNFYTKMKIDQVEFCFKPDGNYTCTSTRIPTSGTYIFDNETKTIQMTTRMGMKIKASVTVLGDSMTLAFNADKILDIISALAGASSSTTQDSGKALSQLLKNYNGMNLGFKLKKMDASN